MRRRWAATGRRTTTGPLTPAERDTLLQDVRARHAAWRARGAVREPWSLCTVEGFFGAIEQAVRRADIVAATYDACLGYPTALRGDTKVDRVDDRFWVTASDLRPRR